MAGMRQMLRGGVAIAVVASGLVPLDPPTRVQAQLAPDPEPVRVRIVDDPAGLAIQPSTVVLVPGQTVIVENDSNDSQEVEATDGSFDSGPIDPGGAFVAAIEDSGSISFSTVGTPSASGRLVFGLPGLPGDRATNARAAIPSLAPPRTDPADISPHPVYGYPTSRTQLILLPSESATVGQVNDALAAVGAVIIGGFDRLGLLTIAVPDTGDHQGVLDAMASLDTSPAFALQQVVDAGGSPIDDSIAPASGVVAPVWQGDVESVPSPFLPDPDGLNWIFAPQASTPRNRGDWGLVASRAPAAWNALDHVRTVAELASPVDTVVLDAGFLDNHPDLDFVSVEQSAVDDHGTHVAGIIGARYDNEVPSSPDRSVGTTGINPVARLSGVEFYGSRLAPGADDPFADSRAYSVTDYVGAFELVLDGKRPGGRYPDLGVINASFGVAVFGEVAAPNWVDKLRGKRCGPGANDDDDPAAAIELCLPSNQDAFRSDFARISGTFGARVLLAAKDLDVAVVKSGGNDNESFCADAGGELVWCGSSAAVVPKALPAVATNQMIRARNQLLAGDPNITIPLLVVGAAYAGGLEVPFSQRGVDLVAPGSEIRSTTIPDFPETAADDERGDNPVQGPFGEWYGELSGTSMAAPYVTGAIGYVMAANPTLTAQQAVDLVLSSAVARSVTPGLTCTSGGASVACPPRLDLYGAVLRAAGIRTVADVNDWTPDGNRRVMRTSDGTSVADTLGTTDPDGDADLGRQRSEPDGKVDLRDVRAFRDGWLHACIDGSLPDAGGAIACPVPDAISLDGAPSNPKRDGNGDGCVTLAGTCVIGEARYSRFDLNGDGLLALNTKAPLFVDNAGAVSASASQLTDWEVLGLALDQREFFDGWAVDDIRSGAVLRSADVTVDLSRVQPGITGLRVEATSSVGSVTTDVTLAADGTATPGVISVPVAAGGSEVEVRYTGSRNGKKVMSGVVTTPALRYGADETVALCEVGLASTGPEVLAHGQTAVITAAVAGCAPGATPPRLDGDVTFEVTPVQPATATSPPTLSVQPRAFDAGGVASTVIKAGTSDGTFRVRATTTGPNGEIVQVDRLVRVVPRIEVRYRWEAEVTSVNQTATTDWPDVVPGRPDCREIAGSEGCIVNATTTLTAGASTPTVTRQGTLTLDDNGVRLDEQVDGRAGSVTIAYTWDDLQPPSESGPGTRTFAFGPLPGQTVTDEPVPVELGIASDGSVMVDGFRFLTGVPYESAVQPAEPTGPAITPEPFGVPGELFALSIPQRSGIQHSADPAGITRLRPSGSGFTPVQWCGNVTTPIVRTPGYRSEQQNDLIAGSVSLATDPTYAPGKVPAPAGTGSFRRSIRVSFTAAVGGAAPDPVLPTCAGASAPTAAFDIAPQPDGVLHEGDAIRFLDASTDPDGDLAAWNWSFGSGRSSSGRDPVLVPGLESTAFEPAEVSLRVADSGGRFNRLFRSVTVAEVLPSISALTPLVTVEEGQRASVSVLVDDPGPNDRRSLSVRVMEGATELLVGTSHPAGTVDLQLPVLAPGAHTITVYVYDGNRQFFEPRVNMTVAVVAGEVDEPEQSGPRVTEIGTCAAPVRVSSEEAALFERWNAARVQAGLPALTLSGELATVAAELATASVGALGLAAGVDVGAAAAAAGYASRDIRALPFSRDLHPADVLEGLRAAELDTVFSTTARMAGVAFVAQGSDVKWVVTVGDVVDCDVAPAVPGAAPVVSVTPPAGPLTEGAPVVLPLVATDPDDDLAQVRVDWGDGTLAGTSHRFRDDGTFEVRVHAVDEAGNTTVAGPIRLEVAGVAPEVDITSGDLVAGVRSTVELAAADPGEADRPLQLTVTSVPVEVLSFTGSIDGGRTLVLTPPVGSTQLDLTVTVTDNDGLATTRSVSLPVATAAGPPPVAPANVAAPPSPACPAGTTAVALRSQAADFLSQANTFRQGFGVSDLVVTKELQAAAEQHLADLVANRYFAHLDSAGRTPLDRARSNGYQGGVGENIAMRFVTGTQVLLGWRSSPVHLANLLDPVWTATGVAVGNGPDGVVWVQVFGTTPTCPTVDRTPVPTPAVLANPALDASAPVASWPPRPASPLPAAPLPARPAVSLPAQTPAPAPSATVSAFTISRLDPTSGETVVVTNRSRIDGVPVAGTLTFGSVSGRRIDAGEGFSRAVFSAQEVSVELDALTASVTVAGTGTYVPQVTILGPAANASFDQGAAVPVRVLVTDNAATPSPLSGVRVRARANPPGADFVVGTTGADGVAELTVRPTVAGSVVLEVQAETVGADTWVAASARNLTIVANTAPVFPPLEAFTVELERSLRLWAPAATDADTPLAYGWDLDGDGVFGDLGLGRDAEVVWADVQAVICGGACTPDVARTVTIRATDKKGATADASTTVTPVRDFTVAVNPQRLSLPPGGTTVIRVTAPTTSGFNLPVQLSAGGLPAGITGTFDRASIIPGEEANLTISVAADYTSTVPIPLAVTGTATVPGRGTVVRTATPQVSVLIGLDRICTVRWSGVVRDILTKAPLAGATVSILGVTTVTTDADGRWVVAQVPVSGNNAPAQYVVEVGRTGYHSRNDARPTAVCDVDRADIDVDLHEKLFVPINVVVRDADAPTVVPARVRAVVSQGGPTSYDGPVDVAGRVTALVPLRPPDNRASDHQVIASAPGYHANAVNRVVSQDNLPGGVAAEVTITRICTARFVGGRVVDADGRPVPGARISYGGLAVVADADARFTIDRDVPLAGRANSPVSVTVNGAPPPDRPDLIAANASREVDQCAPFEMTVVLPLNPNGPERFATLQGRFLSPTGTPIRGGRLSINGLNYYGNNDGTYTARLSIGRQNAITGQEPPPRQFGAFGLAGGTDQFGATDWWPTTFAVTLETNETRTYDIVLEPVRYGTITGVLVDAGTNAPLANQTMDVSSNVGTFGFYQRVTTGSDGRFTAAGMRQRQSGDTTASASSIESPTYWPGRASTPFVGDPPTADLVVPAIPKCAPASVSGLVVDNAPPNPALAGVTVRADTGEQAVTGADGRFRFNAGPYYDNQPREVTITASKDGFVTVSRRVFLFCGATLVVDFAPKWPTTGTISGLVKDADGTALPGIFVGTEYGGGATTDSEGRYSLDGAPPNPDGSPRTWKVTAVPTDASGLLPATVPVAVTGGQSTTAEDLVLRARATAPVNRPPVAVITPEAPSVPEGSVVTFSATSSSDPDGDGLTYSWDLDADGSVDGAAATFDIRFGTPGPRLVKLTVADGRGGATSTQVSATITNVAPTVVAGGDVTIGPDGLFVRSGRFDDPGDGDSFSAAVDWGDGAGFVPLARFGRTLDLAHTFAALGSYPVRVRVCDASDACGEGAFTVRVSSTPPNKAPLALVNGPAQATEGEAVTFDASASTDPEGQALTFAWDLDADGELDDGSTPTVTFTPSALGPRTVVVTVTDPAGATAVASAVVTVVDAAPTIEPVADQVVGAGVALSVTAVVRDNAVAAAGYRATVDWGDGAGPQGVPFVVAGTSRALLTLGATALSQVGTVPLAHAYAAAGRYSVVLAVCDTACTELGFAVTVTTTTSVLELPATGATTMPILRLGLWTIAAGIALVFGGRRRHRHP